MVKQQLIIVLLGLFTFTGSYGQNSSYDDRVKAMELKKEAIRKRKDEYISESGKLYKVGDTITIYGKLGRYEGIRTRGKLLRFKRDPKDVKVIISQIDKTSSSIEDHRLVKAICKGVKRGRYIIYVERAFTNCEIQLCK